MLSAYTAGHLPAAPQRRVLPRRADQALQPDDARGGKVTRARDTGAKHGIFCLQPEQHSLLDAADAKIDEAAYAAAATPSRTGHPSTTTACRPQA